LPHALSWRLRDYDTAIRDFDRACELGMSRACDDAAKARTRVGRTGTHGEDPEDAPWARWLALALLGLLLGAWVWVRRSSAR